MSDRESLNLMRGMNTPRGDGFNPIAPKSHRWMMDISQPEETRGFGWALWRTIDRDPKGQTGTPKKKRSSHAEDVRGTLGVKHMSEDLGISLANASDCLRRLVERGLVWQDEDGRIYPNGDAPEPQRIREVKTNTANKESFFCTENIPATLRLYFQRLNEKDSAQYVDLYFKLSDALSEYLKSLDPESRSHRTWNVLVAMDYRQQLEADALAAARQTGGGAVDAAVADSGFQDTEKRGRTPKPRELMIEFKPKLDFQQFSVQKTFSNSVQNEKPIPYKKETVSVQNSASLYGSSEFSESSELASSSPEENELEATLTEDLRYCCSRLPAMQGRPLDGKTLSKMVASLRRLRTALDLRKVMEVLEQRCRDLARSGGHELYGWGYVVKIVTSEVEQRIGTVTDIGSQIAVAAAGKGMR